MKTARWLGLVLLLWLGGCRPEQVGVGVRVRSEHRLVETVVVVLPESDKELFAATVRRLAPGKWYARERPIDGRVRLSLTRRVDPESDEGVTVEHRVIGPFWLRREYTVTFTNPLSALLAADAQDPLVAALKAQDPSVALRIRLPGRVVADDGAPYQVVHGAAEWTAKVAAAPPSLILVSRAWRRGLLLVVLLGLALALWIAWPAIMPPPEVRAARATRRAERRAAKEQRAAAKQQRVAEKQAQRAGRDAAKAAKRADREQRAAEREAAREDQEEAADEVEQAAPAEAVEAPPEPEREPSPEEPAEADPGTPSIQPSAAPAEHRSQQALRRRRNLLRFRRRR